jgi:hypothetical protein
MNISINREYVREITAKFRRDLAERITSTAVEVGLATTIQQALNLPLWTVPVLTTVFAAVKGVVAKQVGSVSSASLHPDV